MSAPAVLEVLAADRHAPAELSVGSGSSAIGVGLAPSGRLVSERLAALWGRTPPWPWPTFIRCDLDAGRCPAVAWYRDAGPGDFRSPVPGAPPQYLGTRWADGRPDETTRYVQVAGVGPERLSQAARDVGRLAGLRPDALDHAATLAAALARAGWMQTFAATVDGARPRLKLIVATTRLSSVLDATPDAGASGTLRERFRRLRTRLAYAAISVSPQGFDGLRLYSAPVRAASLAGLREASA